MGADAASTLALEQQLGRQVERVLQARNRHEGESSVDRAFRVALLERLDPAERCADGRIAGEELVRRVERTVDDSRLAIPSKLGWLYRRCPGRSLRRASRASGGELLVHR